MRTQSVKYPDYIPAGYDRVVAVESEQEFAITPFQGDVNIVVFPRPAMALDFTDAAAEMAKFFESKKQESINNNALFISEDDLKVFSQSPQAQNFENHVLVLQNDFIFAQRNGYNEVMLRIVRGYKEKRLEKFHDDGTDPSLGRLFCCYNSLTTEFVRNEDVIFRRIKSPPGVAYNVKKSAEPFSLPSRALWKHLGREKLIDPRPQSIMQAAFHRGIASDIPCLRLVADRLSAELI